MNLSDFYANVLLFLQTLTMRLSLSLSSHVENIVHRKGLKPKGNTATHMLSKIGPTALLLPSCRTDFRMGKAYGQRTQPTHAARKIPSLIPSIHRIHRSERHSDVNIKTSLKPRMLRSKMQY